MEFGQPPLRIINRRGAMLAIVRDVVVRRLNRFWNAYFDAMSTTSFGVVRET